MFNAIHYTSLESHKYIDIAGLDVEYTRQIMKENMISQGYTEEAADSLLNSVFGNINVGAWAVVFSPSGVIIDREGGSYYIDPPQELENKRRVFSYYLVKISNGRKAVLHEYVKLQSIHLYDEEIQRTSDPTYSWNRYTVGDQTTVTIINGIGATISETVSGECQQIWLDKKKVNENTRKGYEINNIYKTEWEFPIQDGYYAKETEWQVLGIYDENNKKICGELPEHLTYFRNRVLLADDSSENKNGEYEILQDSYDSTIQYNTIENHPELGYWREGGLIWSVSLLNLSIAKLKEGYLIGSFWNNLYKVDEEGNFEKLGEGLKNFRLRELKNIAKAKK